jgi:hypothetical protein
MSSHFTVVYDACVLYPAPLRDLLMRLALTDLFRARCTDLIHDEWMRNVLAQRPDLKSEDLERTRSLMNAHVRDGLATRFEHLIPSVELPDPDDRHSQRQRRQFDRDVQPEGLPGGAAPALQPGGPAP